jgi:hypothetical protein
VSAQTKKAAAAAAEQQGQTADARLLSPERSDFAWTSLEMELGGVPKHNLSHHTLYGRPENALTAILPIIIIIIIITRSAATVVNLI